MQSLKSNKVGEFGKFVRNRWSILSQSRKDSHAYSEFMRESFNSNAVDAKGIMQPSSLSKSGGNCNWKNKDVMKPIGIQIFLGGESIQNFSWQTSNKVNMNHKRCSMLPSSIRTLASTSASESSRRTTKEEKRKDISTVEDPFDAPTYNIPEKPVTFTEGASYTVIILAGLGVAAAAAYAVFKELIFEPREYKIFNKALARVQNDSQVRVRIGSPVTGYGQESRNRAARQRIPNRTWTDEDGVEHVEEMKDAQENLKGLSYSNTSYISVKHLSSDVSEEVNFYIRGPHGAGKVYCEMFKDKVDKQWKFMYLVVEIKSPSPAQLMLESYIPA